MCKFGVCNNNAVEQISGVRLAEEEDGEFERRGLLTSLSLTSLVHPLNFIYIPAQRARVRISARARIYGSEAGTFY